MSTETMIEDSIIIQPEQWDRPIAYQPLFGGVTMSMGMEKTSIGGYDQIGRTEESIGRSDFGGSQEIHGGTREGVNAHIGGGTHD